MSQQIIPSSSQAHGAFDGGRIQERKPIGFPQDGGLITPYSTLFYWAHAWSKEGGMIGEHPHKGFEIMSVVLSGEIEHYDSQLKGWKKLVAGDVQLIRSGSGITHAEKISKDSSIFQIWFDPDLNKTLRKSASYNDYSSSSLPVFSDTESSAKIIVGGTQVSMDAQVDYIQEITFKVSNKTYPLNKESVYSFFVLEGTLSANGKEVKKNDFVILRDEEELKLTEIFDGTKIFMIKTPLRPAYKTYSEMYL